MSTPDPLPAHEPFPTNHAAERPAPPAFLRERLPLLDILRGFALPGILLMNIEWFSRPLVEVGSGLPADMAPADHAVGWLVFVLVQGKFWLLFSLLFGAGFTVMRQRLLASGRPFVAPYVRRCLALFVIGIAHALLLWAGDILHTYAIAGLLLLAVAALSDLAGDKAAAGCRGIAGAVLFLGFTGLLTVITLASLALPDGFAREQGEADAALGELAVAKAQAIAAYTTGSWSEVTAQRWRDLQQGLLSDIWVVPVALAVFLIGSWLLDSGRLSRPQEHRRFHAWMALAALPLGLAITVAGAWNSTGSVDGQTTSADMINQWTSWVGAPLMTLGYIGIVTLLALRPAPGAWLRRWLAPSGQMALTNYVMASAICSTLFFSYGLGWWGEVSRLQQVGLVVLITIFQCAFSVWWLQRLRIGPLEWLWRAATWLHVPPLRRAAGDALADGVRDRTMNQDADVLIVGGGVIGLACAHYLLAEGLSVRVLEQGRIGSGASHGNCGTLTPSHAAPLAAPGMVGQALRWMLDPAAPLYIAPRWDPALMRWLWKVAGRCNARDWHASGLAKGRLLKLSRVLVEDLVYGEDLDCRFEATGFHYVFRSAKALEKQCRDLPLLAELGIAAHVLDGAALAADEPALLPGMAGALFFPGDAQLRPDRYCAELARIVREAGGVIEEGVCVTGCDRDRNGISAVHTSEGRRSGGRVLLALGAWLPEFAHALRLAIPVQPGKGYSITYERPPLVPRRPLVLKERQVCVTAWDDGYRLGSTMEFSGYDTGLNRRRLDALVRGASQYLREPIGPVVKEEWSGWRPMCADDLPLIGRAPGYNNLWLAGGHGMMGVGMSAGTGRLIAELMHGREPPIDPTPYAPTRFAS